MPPGVTTVTVVTPGGELDPSCGEGNLLARDERARSTRAAEETCEPPLTRVPDLMTVIVVGEPQTIDRVHGAEHDG